MRAWRVAVPLLAGAAIALAPTPSGLTTEAWRYFAVFLAVILGLITEPLPAAAVAWIGLTCAAVLGLPFTAAQRADPAFRLPAETLKWALAGFTNPTVWLIFGALVVSMGYEKTGLGRRLALLLVKYLGARTLGLGYAIALADLVLAPVTPSNSARSAGTIYPIIRNIPAIYGSQPGPTARRIGAYLMWVAFSTTCINGSMFLTAVAPNFLAVELVRGATGVGITWTEWFTGFLPVGMLLFLLLPYAVYRLYPPEIRTSADVQGWATSELLQMGGFTVKEAAMTLLGLGALTLWIFGASFIDPAMVALLAISFMLASRIVSWEDVLGNAPAWNVLAWFATLVVLADGLNKVGFVGWFGKAAAAHLVGYPPIVVMVALVALFFLVHYMFASLTAHATAVLPVVLATGVAVPGMPVRPFGMLLCFSLGLMGVLTPYATGPAPVYFASGFIDRRDFWRLGLIFGLLYLAALLLIGVPWLMAVFPDTQ
jgi:L-tartrate/succinate antiporter